MKNIITEIKKYTEIRHYRRKDRDLEAKQNEAKRGKKTRKE